MDEAGLTPSDAMASAEGRRAPRRGAPVARWDLGRRVPPRHYLGRALRELRKEAGMSQDALFRASGVAQSSIAAYETGRSSPYYDTLSTLASALGVTVSAIVARAEMIEAADRTRA